MSTINRNTGNLEEDGACRLPPFSATAAATTLADIHDVHYRSVETFDSGVNMSLKEGDDGFISTNSLSPTAAAELKASCSETSQTVCSCDVTNEQCNSLAYHSMPDSDNVLSSVDTKSEPNSVCSLSEDLSNLSVVTSVSALPENIYDELLNQDEDGDS